MSFWLNGEFCEDARAISIADRGFLLGDGLFETLLLIDGAPIFLKRHLARLRASAAILEFDIPCDDAELRQAISKLATKNELNGAQAVCRITLTRGPGGRGLELSASESAHSTLLVTVSAFRPLANDRSTLIVSKYRRAERSIAAAHKVTGYLDNIMARAEAVNAGADDAVMLNSGGRAACAAAANIFAITHAGVVHTPPVGEGALPGVVRQVLLDEAQKAGVAIAETPIEAAALDKSSLFLTNSLTAVRPAALAGGGPRRNEKAADILKCLQSCYGDAVMRELNDGRGA